MIKDLAELKALKLRLKLRAEAAAVAEQQRREREREANLFRNSVGEVEPLKSPPRVLTPPPRPQPIAHQRLADDEAALHESMRDVVKDVLDSLTPREAKVLRMRFGVEMSTDHTLEEVGKQFDVTRERIRQIEAKALRKMRHPSRSDKLKTFLEED